MEIWIVCNQDGDKREGTPTGLYITGVHVSVADGKTVGVRA